MLLNQQSTHFFLTYLIAISFIAAIVTVFDKASAKVRGPRIPESVLLLLSMIGGSATMFLIMLCIRHKTRHIKFMLGIPVIMGIQLLIIYFLYTHHI